MSDVRCQMSVAGKARVSSLTSDISSWRDYANTMARHALRRANVAQTTWLHVDRPVDNISRRRGEHGHLQRHQCGAAAPVAVPRIRTAGAIQRAQSADGRDVYLLAELYRLARAAACFR